jgi:hypothetical protein
MRNRNTALYVAMFWAMAIVGVACSDTTAPAAPAAVTFTQPAPPSAPAGNAVPLRVGVTDRNGSPLAGVTVDWTVTAGSVNPSHAVTNSRGRADAVWWVGNEPGWQTATARVGSLRATTSVSVEGAGFPPEPEDNFFLTVRVSSPSGETLAELTSPDPRATWPTGATALLTEFVGAPDRTAASLGASFMPGGYVSFTIADVPEPFRVGTYLLGSGPQSELPMWAHPYLLQGRAPLPWAILYGGGYDDYDYRWVTGTFASSLEGKLVVDTVRSPSRPDPLADFGGDGLLVGRFAVRAFASVWSGPGAPPGEILLTGHFRVPYGHLLKGHADLEVLEGRSTGITIGRPAFGHNAPEGYPAFYRLVIDARVPGSAEDAGFFQLEVVTPDLDVGSYPIPALTGDMFQDPLRRPATHATLSWPDPTAGNSLFLSTGGVLHVEKSRPRSDYEYGELTGTIELDAAGWDLRPGGGETGETVRVRARFTIP